MADRGSPLFGHATAPKVRVVGRGGFEPPTNGLSTKRWPYDGGRRGTTRLPTETCTASPLPLRVVVRTLMIPCVGRDFDGRTSSTSPLRVDPDAPGPVCLPGREVLEVFAAHGCSVSAAAGASCRALRLRAA